MSEHESPYILFIDDNEEQLRPLADAVNAKGDVDSLVIGPDDVDDDGLKRADLVAVDYTLDDWTTELASNPISAVPLNGIALAAVLRQHSHRIKSAPPTAFALITGNADSLGQLPAEQRAHVVSRLSNLEWFFQKQTETKKNAQQLVSLASAVRQLPENVVDGLSSLDTFLGFLGVHQGDELSERYAVAVSRCRPPIHYLAKRSHGLVVLRWLLHRILPHTCFLLDSVQLAARLRVRRDALETALANGGTLAAELEQFRYCGPLHDFDGLRWWRDGIEQWLWNKTDGESASDESVVAVVNDAAGQQLEPIGKRRPVAALDENFRREDDFASYDEVVAVQLDDWPSYAEPAYFRRDLVEEHKYLAMFLSSN